MERVTYRGLYGSSPCTLTEMVGSPYGTHYMSYDRDPGIGRMAFPVSHGFRVLEPAVRCPGCSVYAHLASWPCPMPHGVGVSLVKVEPRAGCRAHLSCRLPRVSPGMVSVCTADHGHGVYHRVMYGPDTVGTVSDRSYVTHTGETRTRWSAFGGGNHLGDFPSHAAAVEAVCRNANDTVMSWRGALHN